MSSHWQPLGQNARAAGVERARAERRSRCPILEVKLVQSLINQSTTTYHNFLNWLLVFTSIQHYGGYYCWYWPGDKGDMMLSVRCLVSPKLLQLLEDTNITLVMHYFSLRSSQCLMKIADEILKIMSFCFWSEIFALLVLRSLLYNNDSKNLKGWGVCIFYNWFFLSIDCRWASTSSSHNYLLSLNYFTRTMKNN